MRDVPQPRGVESRSHREMRKEMRLTSPGKKDEPREAKLTGEMFFKCSLQHSAG
jgi:hypothetical protein